MHATLSTPVIGIATMTLTAELQHSYRLGLLYPLADVRKQFIESLAIAHRAQAELADEALIAASLLYRPCQMLFTGVYTSKPWNSDSLLETGTYDWLVENFDSAVAETIRLQPHVRRYLASVIANYYDQLDEHSRHEILRNGGIMTRNASIAFARTKHFSQSLQLSRWIHQVSKSQLENSGLPDFEHFLSALLPSVARAAR